jgi:hypothetical protein
VNKIICKGLVQIIIERRRNYNSWLKLKFSYTLRHVELKNVGTSVFVHWLQRSATGAKKLGRRCEKIIQKMILI